MNQLNISNKISNNKHSFLPGLSETDIDRKLMTPDEIASRQKDIVSAIIEVADRQNGTAEYWLKQYDEMLKLARENGHDKRKAEFENKYLKKLLAENDIEYNKDDYLKELFHPKG